MKRSLSAAELLALPVRLRGITLGRPADILLERRPFRAVALDVECRDGVRRLLPIPAVAATDAELAIESPLYLLAEAQSTFYRRRAHPFSELRGTAVDRGGRRLGRLSDVLLDPGGTVTALVVEGDSGPVELAATEGLSLAGRPLRAA